MVGPDRRDRWWALMPLSQKPTIYDVCSHCGHVRWLHRIFPLGEVVCIAGYQRDETDAWTKTRHACDCVSSSEEYAHEFHVPGLPQGVRSQIQDSITRNGAQRLIGQPAVPGKPIRG